MAKDDGIDCSKDVCRTQQSAKEECDINYIVERAKRGADLSQLTRNTAPMYGDFSSIPTDLRECLVIVRRADELFMTLDAHVRRRFDNDPAKMLDFLNDPKNRSEAVELGLVNPPKEDVKAPIEPVTESVVPDVSPKGKKKGAGGKGPTGDDSNE